jgi:hypothetical protein
LEGGLRQRFSFSIVPRPGHELLLVGANLVSLLASRARQTPCDRLARTAVIGPE